MPRNYSKMSPDQRATFNERDAARKRRIRAAKKAGAILKTCPCGCGRTFLGDETRVYFSKTCQRRKQSTVTRHLCRDCGKVETPSGGRCKDCRNLASKMAGRRKRTEKPQQSPAAFVPVTQGDGIAPLATKESHSTRAAIERVIRREYERSDEARRAELRFLNRDIVFEQVEAA